MTPAELTPLMAHYEAGLATQIDLLRQLDALASQERAVTRSTGLEGLPVIVEERERIMTALLEIEHALQPMREQLAAARDELAPLPAFAGLRALHREAATLAATILASDAQSIEALQEAELVRRAAAQTLEQSESTLAAYRRAGGGAAAPALFNQRG